MLVPAPLGDVVDRITICRLKTERISDPARLAHARRELTALTEAWRAEGHPEVESLQAWAPLLAVNAALWEVEDLLRDCERQGDFGPRFVELARSVYRLNDQRAVHKRAINDALGSDLVEVKSYAAY